MKGNHRAVGPLSAASGQEECGAGDRKNLRQERGGRSQSEGEREAAGATKPHRPGPRGPTKQREPQQSWSHTRWSEHKRSECEQEPHGYVASVINTQETAGPKGSRICPAARAGGWEWGVGWPDSLLAKAGRWQEPGAAGSRRQQNALPSRILT